MIRRLLHSPRRAAMALAAIVPIGAIGIWGLMDQQRSLPVSAPAPLAPPTAPMQVYHLGHSLVGAEVPHLLQQFAGAGHSYNMQRGSGTSLRAHWDETEEILDFEQVNAAPIWRAPRAAIASGDYDAVILTEMVELRDAIRYFDGAKFLHLWAELTRNSNAETRLYLYETWHRLDDPAGWLTRIDRDLDALWLGQLMAKDARAGADHPIYLIPGGQVLGAVVRAAEAGQLAGVTQREQLFARNEDGSLDQIHLSPLGAYVIAMAHYAVLYHLSPEGLPHQVTLSDGTPFAAFNSAEAAAETQALIWQVVTRIPHTGLSPAAPAGAQPTKVAS